MRFLLAELLVVLQLFVVVFIALHDWVPLPPLNNIAAVKAADSRTKLITVTVLSTAPFLFGLISTIVHVRERFPDWLNQYLWICYGLALYGMVRAWWGPYLFYDDPARAARYQRMFSGTHVFLPMRNGIQPNTLHVVLHAVIVGIVIDLIVLRA